MSLQDKEKWDNKYLTKKQLLKPRDASSNLKDWISYCGGTNALDLACGAGRNSIYLAKSGFDVDALDIAKVALDTLESEAKQNGLSNKINTFLVDLDAYEIEKEKYDLIIMTNFLDRSLIESAKIALKKDGILFIETYMISDENEKDSSNSNNLLKSKELMQTMDDSFDILYYDEFKNEDYEIYKMEKQVIVAKKV